MTAARVLKGDTTSAMLVHSLAISAVADTHADVVPSIFNAPNGAVFQRSVATIPFALLQSVVGNALALSTLKGIVSKHPALTLFGDKFDRKVQVVLDSKQVDLSDR